MDPAGFFAAAEQAFAAAAARTAERAHWFRIAGRRVCLRFAGNELAGMLEPVFAHLRIPPAPMADLTVLVWDHGETGIALPPRPWSPEQEGVQGRVEFPQGEYAALIDGGGIQVWLLDRAGGRGVVWFRGAAEMPYWERIHPLRQFLEAWAASLGLQMVHAGGVAFDGAGALLIGPGGSGKSTSVLACIAAGARSVGDDYVLIDAGARPAAHSLYGTMRLFESHVRRFPFLMPEHDSVAPGHDGTPKLTAYVSVRRPASLVETLPIAAILIPSVAGGAETRLRRESGGAALFALAPNSLKQLDPTSREAFARMARLCRALPCWRLELGADAASIAARVREAIERSAAGPAPAAVPAGPVH